MPALMTHDFFGKDVLEEVSLRFGFATLAERDAYLLGNQGPDPLFYLFLDPKHKDYKSLGSLCHHEKTDDLLLNLHDAISMLAPAERKVGEAYAAGFISHYLLDTTVHPFVYSWQFSLCDAGVDGLDRSSGSLVHAEIERDLDEMVLYTKREKTILDYKPYREVFSVDESILPTIDKLYFYIFLWTYSKTLPMDLFSSAYFAFKRTQRLLYSPRCRLQKIVGTLERLGKKEKFSLYVAMSHRVRASIYSAFDNRDNKSWKNYFTASSQNESFWELYNLAQAKVIPALDSFFDSQFDLVAASSLTGKKNFSGECLGQSLGI